MTTLAAEPALAAAVPGPRSSEGPEWLRIGSVALAVRDLDRVEAFYRDVVGLQVVGREKGVVRLGCSGNVLLELLHRPNALADDPVGSRLVPHRVPAAVPR